MCMSYLLKTSIEADRQTDIFIHRCALLRNIVYVFVMDIYLYFYLLHVHLYYCCNNIMLTCKPAFSATLRITTCTCPRCFWLGR